MQSDLLNPQDVHTELHEFQPDIIIHLAARTEVETSFYEPASFTRVNYEGTVSLIESARTLKNLQLFLFSSTMETYGWQSISDEIKVGRIPATIPVFDENTLQHPNAPYAVAKLACESYLEYAARSYGLPFCILRQTNTYGRAETDFFVVEQIISQMLRGSVCRLGNAEPWRNFLHIDDLVALYRTVASSPAKCRNQIFCTGPSNALSIHDLAKKIANLLNWRGEIIWNQKPIRAGEIYFLNSTGAHAQSVLGWEPRISLEDGLKGTIEVWRKKLKGSKSPIPSEPAN